MQTTTNARDEGAVITGPGLKPNQTRPDHQQEKQQELQVQPSLPQQTHQQQRLEPFAEDCALLLQEINPQLSTLLLPRNYALPHPAGPLPTGSGADLVQSATDHVGSETTSLHYPRSSENDVQVPSTKSRVPPAAVPREAATEIQLPRDTQSALIEAFFMHSHILYPVVPQGNFRVSYSNGSISNLLLYAVYYAGALHAPDSTIHRAGFDTRQTCLKALYGKAKALFFEDEGSVDVNDQITRIQAAFLLHTMCSSQSITMDCWTWLSLAIRLAQKIGMHRNTARPSLRMGDGKLWKIIWWSLFVGLCGPEIHYSWRF